ncbi:hypothetical protein XENOCAPTIV_026816 [Xenoophorus captivus]|uniref:Uncharacterized protein n=1 Tax=Xenoophorus captivus TaxID=1517983 RepID=A0ABV0QN69_9TELE
MFDGVTRLLRLIMSVLSNCLEGNRSSCSTMVDIDVKRGAAWVCQTQGCKLADILLPVHLNNRDDEEDLSQSHKETDQVAPVVLEQVEEGSPCILTLSCSPSFPTAFSSLMVISEARTIEVYNQLEEYCGTVRGTKDESIQSDRYRNLHWTNSRQMSGAYLCTVACRSIVYSLCFLTHTVNFLCLTVQTEVLSIGSSLRLSIRLQPVKLRRGFKLNFELKRICFFQNQTGSLGGFLPLLMGGGAFSALAGGVGIENGVPVNHTQLEEMMSHFLKGRSHGQALSPELLPMLQSVCGQVTQLRLDNAGAALLERDKKMRNSAWTNLSEPCPPLPSLCSELDSVMERRLEEMEQRLKEHMDRRLDTMMSELTGMVTETGLKHPITYKALVQLYLNLPNWLQIHTAAMGVVWTLCIPLMMVWAFKGSCSSVIATNSRVAELQHQQKEQVETNVEGGVRSGSSKPGDCFLGSSTIDDPNIMPALNSRIARAVWPITEHPWPLEDTLPTRRGPVTVPTRPSQTPDPVTNRPMTFPTRPRTRPGHTELPVI